MKTCSVDRRLRAGSRSPPGQTQTQSVAFDVATIKPPDPTSGVIAGTSFSPRPAFYWRRRDHMMIIRSRIISSILIAFRPITARGVPTSHSRDYEHGDLGELICSESSDGVYERIIVQPTV